MAKEIGSLIALLNSNKQYNSEQLKQKLAVDTNEQVVLMLFRVIELCSFDRIPSNKINKMRFFSNITYHLNAFINKVDIGIYINHIDSIVSRLNEKDSNMGYIYRNFLVYVSQFIFEKIRKNELLGEFLKSDNIEEIKANINNNKCLINCYNFYGTHLMSAFIAKYVRLLMSSEQNNDLVNQYYGFIDWMINQPFLCLSNKDISQAIQFLNRLPEQNTNILLLSEKIKKHVNAVQIIEDEIKANGSLKGEEECLIKIMQRLKLNSYAELLELLLILLDKNINRPLMENKDLGQTIPTESIRYCFFIIEGFPDCDENYIRKIISILQDIRMRFTNSIKEKNSIEFNLLIQVVNKLYALEQKCECFLKSQKMMRKNSQKKEIQEQLNGLDETINLMEIPPDKKERRLLWQLKRRLAIIYDVNIEFNSFEVENKQLYTYDGRVDFTSQEVITIDNPDVSVFDDAIYLESEAGDFCDLYVHIALPHDLFRHRQDIKESILSYGSIPRIKGMQTSIISREISTSLLSLKSGQERNVITHKFRFYKNGHVDYSCVRGIINVRRNLTVEEANKILKGGSDDKKLESMLSQMAELAVKIKQRNNIEDALLNHEFDTGVCMNSHLINAVFMILTNSTVGQFFSKHHYPAIYKIQAAPDDKFLLKPSTYHWENTGHYTGGYDAYCSVTSPLQQPVDCIMGGEFLEAFLIPKYPNFSDYEYYEAFAKKAVSIIKEADTNYLLFCDAYERQKRQELKLPFSEK